MSVIGLTFYELRFKVKGKGSRRSPSYANLDHLDGKFADAITAIDEFFKQMPLFDASIDVKTKDTKNLYLEKNTLLTQNRQISGIVRCGDGGFSSALFDGKTGKKSYDRKVEDIELLPFYFLLDAPQNKKSLLISLQTFGVYGVSTKFNASLKSFLEPFYQKYIVQLHVIQVGNLFAKKYVSDGNIKSIEGIEYFSPRDKASDSQKEIKCKHIYSPAKRGDFFGRALNKMLLTELNSQRVDNDIIVHKVNSLISLNLPAVNELKFEIDVNGVRRKVDMSDLSKSATKYDVTEEVDVESSGHPKFKSIDDLAKDITSNDVRGLIRT